MIEIKNLSKKYDTLEIFQDFNLTIHKGEILCLLGPSGCGKTTLLNILSGLTPYDRGSIEGIGHSFSYIFQETRLLPWKTVEENISFVLKNNNKPPETITQKYLEIVELTPYKNYYPNQLSGGMKQRVSIARAFAYQSEILLMDEPFKGLDLELKRNLIKAFLSLWKEDPRTTLFVTHDIEEALLLSDTIYILKDQPAKIREKIKIELPQEKRDLNLLTLCNYKNKIIKALENA